MVAMTVSVVLAMERRYNTAQGQGIPRALLERERGGTRSHLVYAAFLSRFDLVSVAFQSRVERWF